jgi:hypothetical protein
LVILYCHFCFFFGVTSFVTGKQMFSPWVGKKYAQRPRKSQDIITILPSLRLGSRQMQKGKKKRMLFLRKWASVTADRTIRHPDGWVR